jgi:hypothetical protein
MSTEGYSSNSMQDFSSQSKLNIFLHTNSSGICLPNLKHDKNSVRTCLVTRRIKDVTEVKLLIFKTKIK